MRRSGSSSGVGGLARAPRQVLAKATPARAARNGVAAVASVSAGAHQPEGARRGGKEAAEVACADRDEGASEDQAPEEDLARQVETRHACPAALRGLEPGDHYRDQAATKLPSAGRPGRLAKPPRLRGGNAGNGRCLPRPKARVPTS